MSRLGKLSLVILGFIVLTGCGSLPRQEFNTAANQHIKKIVVVTNQEPEDYMVEILHHPGASFGLVGGLVAAADILAKSNSFTEAVRSQPFSLVDEFKSSLKGMPLGEKYEIEFVQAPQPDSTEFLEDFSKLNKQADAVLDIRFYQAGYRAQYPTSPYAPALMAKTQLVDTRNKEKIYEATLHYGEAWIQRDGLVQVNNDPAYSFNNFEDLTAESDKARIGMLAGAKALAERISQDLQ